MLSTANAIEPEDFIYCNSWGRLARELNHPNLFYIQNENVGEFLKNPRPNVFVLNRYRPTENHLIELPKNFILLSGYSDYGVCEQAIDHPNKDLVKLANSINYAELEQHSQYVAINLQTVAPGCNSNDKYSVKIERYTKDTFNGFPTSLARLFTSNCNIKHDRVAWLPFGLGVADFQDKEGPAKDFILKYRNMYEKNNLLYINFSNHTYQRSLLNEHFRHFAIQSNGDYLWQTYRWGSINQEEFFKELCTHKFCLCPFGNGLDSYRIWECLYCGVIPIIQDCVFSRNLAEAGLPVHVVPNLFELTETSLLKVYSNMMTQTFNLNALRLSWWREQICDAVAKLEHQDGGCLPG